MRDETIQVCTLILIPYTLIMPTNISKTVIRRVRRIYYLRKFTHPTMLKLYGTAAVVVSLISHVSIPNVLANTPGNVLDGVVYLAHALSATELAVQALCLLATVFAGMVVKDMVSTARVFNRVA